MNLCHEEVHDADENLAQPCEKRAVGWRVEPEENKPYPVCIEHHRWPYADEWVEAVAERDRARATAVALEQEAAHHRAEEWELIDSAGITWQSRARRLASRLREAGEVEVAWSSAQYGIRTPDGEIRSIAVGPAEAERYRAANVDIHVRQQTVYKERVTEWQPMNEPAVAEVTP